MNQIDESNRRDVVFASRRRALTTATEWTGSNG